MHGPFSALHKNEAANRSFADVGPAVAALIRDETGQILLQRKHDATWSLPAGAIEPGESSAQAIIREVCEETGLTVRPTRIAGVFGGLGFRYRYSNGDEVEYTVVIFECSPMSSSRDDYGHETERLEYFPCARMPALSVGYPAHLFAKGEDLASYFEPTN